MQNQNKLISDRKMSGDEHKNGDITDGAAKAKGKKVAKKGKSEVGLFRCLLSDSRV